jgi:hypothetical protein
MNECTFRSIIHASVRLMWEFLTAFRCRICGTRILYIVKVQVQQQEEGMSKRDEPSYMLCD